MENYPKIEEPVVPDLENSRFLYVGFYCIHGDKFGGEQNTDAQSMDYPHMDYPKMDYAAEV